LDGDGELTSDELRAAIVSTLKRTSSTQDAEDLIQILDSDKDGKGDILIQIVEHIMVQFHTKVYGVRNKLSILFHLSHNSVSGGAFGLY
jgi:hypothetical protein